MPRLQGKRSSTGAYIVVLIVFAIVVLVLLEYIGTINLIPGFGS